MFARATRSKTNRARGVPAPKLPDPIISHIESPSYATIPLESPIYETVSGPSNVELKCPADFLPRDHSTPYRVVDVSLSPPSTIAPNRRKTISENLYESIEMPRRSVVPMFFSPRDLEIQIPEICLTENTETPARSVPRKEKRAFTRSRPCGRRSRRNAKRADVAMVEEKETASPIKSLIGPSLAATPRRPLQARFTSSSPAANAFDRQNRLPGFRKRKMNQVATAEDGASNSVFDRNNRLPPVKRIRIVRL